MPLPQRIVCLTEESVETLYLLGAQDRIVGVSAYTMRPPEARAKPRVSAFTTANFDRIETLAPDLILAFSDLQADIAAELIRRGHPVVTFNQRSIDEILQTILMIGGLVGRDRQAAALVRALQRGIEAIRHAAQQLDRRPRVYFEEWDDPLICGIQWVDELIEVAGGASIFAEHRNARLARDRIVTADEVARRDPELIVASWCGKRVQPARIESRPGWNAVSAVRHGHVYEIKSALILQPGPAALTDGVQQLHQYVARVATAPPR